MMMNMLRAGGLELVVDNERKPDKDNPKGYFEFEKAKKIRRDASWLNQIDGKGVKVISWLLYYLPPIQRYKILFMERHMQEILASQRKMLERFGKKAHGVDDTVLAIKFNDHLREIRDWLHNQPNIDCLYVEYRDTIDNPFAKISEIVGFLEMDLDMHAMVRVIDGSLYRNRH
jgi:hypothetical protein